MPLVGPVLKQKFESTIKEALDREFGTDHPEQHKKMAAAISDIAKDIVDAIHKDAMVSPGIPVTTAGPPAAHTGASIAPGKIL